MNKLSLMLWLSDLLPNLGTLCGITGSIGAIAATVFTALGIAMNSEYAHKQEHWEAVRKRCSVAARQIWIVVVALWVVAVVTPSKTTIMAIAASEAAQIAIDSPSGQEITNDALTVIKGWLKSQIKETK